MKTYQTLGPILLLASFVTSTQAQDLGYTRYGSGCSLGSGVVPQIDGYGSPAGGYHANLIMRGAPPNRPVVALVGFQPSATSLPNGCSVLVDLTQPSVIFAVATDAAGIAGLSLPLPDHPLLIGNSFYTQFVTLTPTGNSPVAFSDGLATKVGFLPEALNAELHVAADLSITGANGGSGSAPATGSIALRTFGLYGSVDLMALSLHADNVVLPGGETGELFLSLDGPTSMSTASLFDSGSMVGSVMLNLRYDQQMQDVDYIDFDADDHLAVPLQTQVPAVLALVRDPAHGFGTLYVATTAPADSGLALLGNGQLDLVGDVEIEDQVTEDHYKKDLCVRVHIVAKDDGSDPATTLEKVTAQVNEANANTWCKQCCIRIVIDEGADVIKVSKYLSLDSVVDGDTSKPGCQVKASTEMVELLETNATTDCVDLYYIDQFVNVPANCPTPAAVTRFGGTRRARVVLSDDADGQTLAHELGHALGLRHSESGENLMWKAQKDVWLLSEEQCSRSRTTNPMLVKTTELCDGVPGQ